MATVYVTQHDGRFDLGDAARFGETKVVYRRDLFPDEIDEQLPAVMERARHVLCHFDVTQDYLCLIGSPLYVAICAYMLGRMNKFPAKLLRYDKIERRYYEIPVR
jgi:hypothetical protein